MKLRCEVVDWRDWTRLHAVTVGEACALAVGLEPGEWQRAKASDDWNENMLVFEAARILEIAHNHIAHGVLPLTDLGEPAFVRLAEFRSWGEGLEPPLDFPEQFPKAATPDPAAPAASEPAQAKPLGTRERDTLLCIIGALARQAGLDLSQPMKAGDTVAAMAPELSMTGRTIGEHLKRVGPAMDGRTK